MTSGRVSHYFSDTISMDKTLTGHVSSRAARYRKINLDIVLTCLNIQDNNRYNIYIQFSNNIKIVVSRM